MVLETLNQQVLTVLDHHYQELAIDGKDVIEGLSKKQKNLPAKYFYDDPGSLLFEKICELPEYYPTR
ncbi:MAG: L-histidine N(alpha)-methyltransferase, partial [Dolichospermum sp.]